MIGIGPGAVNARKTRCIHGHSFSPENTRLLRNGERVCLACEERRGKTYKTKNPEAGKLASQRYRDRHGVYWSRSSHCYVKKL